MAGLDSRKLYDALVSLFPPRPALGVEVDISAFMDVGDHIHLQFRLGSHIVAVAEPLPDSFLRFRPDVPIQGKLVDALDAWFSQQSTAWAESVREAINLTLRRLSLLISVGEVGQRYHLRESAGWNKTSLEKITEREDFNRLGIKLWLTHKKPAFASPTEHILALKDFLTPMEMDQLWEACKPDSSKRGYSLLGGPL